MKTISFIGSEKNAGKTTSMNYITQRLQSRAIYCITSIGVNGEKEDLWYGTPKPIITIPQDHYFLTHERHTLPHLGHFTIIDRFFPHNMGNYYLLGKANREISLLLEGPNNKDGLLYFKKELKIKIHKIDFLFIDGSIDRSVIGHPSISDAFFLSLTLKKRLSPERRKMEKFLIPFSIPKVEDHIEKSVHKSKRNKNFRMAFFNGQKERHSLVKTFFERISISGEEFNILEDLENPYIYCHFALTNSILKKIPPHVQIILDNFTLFQVDHISKKDLERVKFLNTPHVLKIFLKEDSYENIFPPILEKYSKCNLYREDSIHEISIPL